MPSISRKTSVKESAETFMIGAGKVDRFFALNHFTMNIHTKFVCARHLNKKFILKDKIGVHFKAVRRPCIIRHVL